MIDYNAILSRMVVEARNAVGPLLSLTGPIGDQRASVMKSRLDTNKPDYPYIVVDILETVSEEYLDGSFINDGGDLQHDITKRISFQYTVYGTDSSTKTSALGIADQLKSHFVIGSVREGLREDISIGVSQTSSVESAHVQISGDKYLEVALFTMVLSVCDAVITPTAEFIDTIHVDGQVFEDDDDLDPTIINIDVTSQ